MSTLSWPRANRLLPLLGLAVSCSGGDEKPAKDKADEKKPEVAKIDTEPAPVKDIPKRSKSKTPSVVMITMDTTRADHIGAYGYEKALTPTVDALANEGMLFERAYAVVPLTTPSHASMMTGLYPTRHGIHNNGDAILDDRFTTLAEVLNDEGYATAASVSAFVTTRVWNLDQGFQAYFDSVKADKSRQQRGRWAQERPADQVVDDLIGWLDGRPGDDRPFFIWAHFYDPHDPYQPSKEWLDKAEGRAYDGEIGFMDSQIARLQEAVNRNSGEAGAGWVLIADHGEAFNREHGEHTHGMYLYDTTMRIPFIVRPPKPLDKPVVESKQTVSNVDLTPTVLGMLGYKAPEDIDGVDLSGFLKGGSLEHSPVYMEAESARNRFGFAPERAVAHGPLKLMDTPNPRLFDVVADPGELTNLVEKLPDDVDRLRKAHEAIQARREDAGAAGGMASPEVMAALEALGYMSSDGNVGDEETAKLDAKDQTELIQKLDRARGLTRRGKFKKAIALFESVIEEHPQIAEARMNLSKALMRVGRKDDGIRVLEEAIEIDPTSTVLKSNLAGAFAQSGQPDKAMELFNAILLQVPGDEVARNGIVSTLIESGRMPDALEKASEYGQSDPDNRTWDAHLGVILARMNRVPEALPHLQRAMEDDMPRAHVHATLAAIALATGDLDASLQHLQQESDWFPQNLQVRMQIASIHMREKRWEEAASEFSYVAQARPKDPISRRMWAQAIFNTGDYPGAAEILAPAVEYAPDDAYVLLMHANILQKLGKEGEAKKVFARATEIHEEMIARQKAEQGEGIDPLGLGTDPADEMAEFGIPE